MTSASPRRMISVASPIACELAAQAVRQLALGPRAPKRLARCPAGVPGSCSASRIGCSSLRPRRGEGRGVDLAALGAGMHQADEPGEVLLALARAEVDAEPRAVEPLEIGQAGVLHRHRRGGDGEQGVAAAIAPALGVGDVVFELEPARLGGDAGREGGGVEQRDRAHAAPALPGASRPGRLQVAADRASPCPSPSPRLVDAWELSSGKGPVSEAYGSGKRRAYRQHSTAGIRTTSGVAAMGQTAQGCPVTRTNNVAIPEDHGGRPADQAPGPITVHLNPRRLGSERFRIGPHWGYARPWSSVRAARRQIAPHAMLETPRNTESRSKVASFARRSPQPPARSPRTIRAAAWPWRVRLVVRKVGLSEAGAVAHDVELARRVGVVAIDPAGSGPCSPQEARDQLDGAAARDEVPHVSLEGRDGDAGGRRCGSGRGPRPGRRRRWPRRGR